MVVVWVSARKWAAGGDAAGGGSWTCPIEVRYFGRARRPRLSQRGFSPGELPLRWVGAGRGRGLRLGCVNRLAAGCERQRLEPISGPARLGGSARATASRPLLVARAGLTAGEFWGPSPPLPGAILFLRGREGRALVRLGGGYFEAAGGVIILSLARRPAPSWGAGAGRRAGGRPVGGSRGP